jgi:transcriptional regulator with XRE-family HTH domain
LDRVRDCIRAANRRGVTAYALSMKAGVARSQISRLMRRKNSLLVPTAEAIVKAAGYEIVIVPQMARIKRITALHDAGRLNALQAARLMNKEPYQIVPYLPSKKGKP